jgi:nicotinate-nucleotide--dimethylbenzimidazole phosphoribosyltransferase
VSLLHDLLNNLPDADSAASDAVIARAAQNLRPSGAFGRLDEVAGWLAGWQRTTQPSVNRPHALIFASDHGVAADGVSAYPAEVTQAMLAAVQQGKATITALGAAIGVTVEVIDVGVGVPTENFRHTAAMSPERFDDAVRAGQQAVAALDTDLLVLGELGIGNTTTAAAVAACLLGGDAAGWVGRGTGVDDEGLARKTATVADAQARIADVTDPIEILRQVGGAEFAAMAGAIIEARRRSIPVVLDGFVATAAVIPLHTAVPGALDHCIAGHRSPEPGHLRLLELLGKRPLIELNLRLGEGSGAMVSVPLIKMAAAAVVNVATFGEWFGEP